MELLEPGNLPRIGAQEALAGRSTRSSRAAKLLAGPLWRLEGICYRRALVVHVSASGGDTGGGTIPGILVFLRFLGYLRGPRTAGASCSKTPSPSSSRATTAAYIV